MMPSTYHAIMNRFLLAAATLACLACDSSTGNDDFVLLPQHVEVAPVTASVEQGTAIEVRFTNHTDRELKAATLVQDVDIWPDERLWDELSGALYKVDGGVVLPPGETVIEVVDYAETLAPGAYQFNIGISAWNGNTPVGAMWKSVSFSVEP